MYIDLTEEEKLMFDVAVDHINDGLCKGARVFSIKPEASKNLLNCIMDAFREERWAVDFDEKQSVIELRSNIQKPVDNKPADFKTGLRPVSQ